MRRRRHQQQATVIAEGLKITGNVQAEGSVELHGKIEGELHCTSLRISENGHITGKVAAEDVAVNGTVEGPIYGNYVRLESQAHVTGNVHHETFAIEKGAFFDGRSKQKGHTDEKKPAKKDTGSNSNVGSDPEANKVTKLPGANESPAT